METFKEHPRIKKGKITPMYKEGNEGGFRDFLIQNSYFATCLDRRPLYWGKLLRLLYGEGRLYVYASIVEDIVDKFSFLFLSKDQIISIEGELNWSKRFYIKYYTYTFVYLTKSLLDSLAVFINEIFKLGFSGGDIDFKKGNFMDGLKIKNQKLADLINKRKNWIDTVVKYRDNLIHRHGLYVGPCPEVPPELKDEAEINMFILKEPYYLPNNPNLVEDIVYKNKEGELIKLTCFLEEWINESSALFDIVLGTFAENFTREKWFIKNLPLLKDL
ncbi:MAG: Cthe_2314 family HEPN domain-containing protein [Thermodesulfobacteriota bacterium]